jgi:hypothetical protein
MSWPTITEDDLRSSINASEDKAIRGSALSEGQADPYVSVKAQVIGLFRNAIRSGPGNRLDPDEATLPASAIFHAVAKIRYRLLTRFASELLDDDRRTENKEAEAWLKEVRRGVEKIEQPDDEPGETHAPEIEVSGDVPDRQWTRKQQSGL